MLVTLKAAGIESSQQLKQITVWMASGHRVTQNKGELLALKFRVGKAGAVTLAKLHFAYT